MERQAVKKSTSIKSIGYTVGDDRKGTLEVEFINGRVYRYFDVPPAVAGEITMAEVLGMSVGAAIKQKVVGHFRFHEIDMPKETK